MKIILASTSPYRKKLLDRTGLTFECHKPICDEDEYKKIISCPTELSRRLSLEKARSLKIEDSLIIGSDQVCVFNNVILGKGGTEEKTFQQLKMLQGQTHKLITSFAITTTSREIIHTNITELTMKKLSDKQIKKYIELDKPMDCAGSYKLEEHGISLFSEIKTKDHSAIIGLPIMELLGIIKTEFNIEVFT